MKAIKLQRLLGILAKLDMDTQEDLIDETICFLIDKGVDGEENPVPWE